MSWFYIFLKWLPFIPFGKKVVEETVESIEQKELPTKEELIEIIESLPLPSTKNEK